MKTTERIVAPWLLAAGTLLTLSLRAESLRTDVNPALRYYQAFLVAPDISETDFDYLATNNLWSPVLPQKFGEIVAGYDPEFKLVRQAAEATVPCDWGIDMSEGPATLLPQLARCKAVMVGARYRVAWDLQQTNQAGARDDLLAAFVLARNISRDGTLISLLVQFAGEAIGTGVVQENFGKFSPQTLQRIIQGIDSGPARGSVAASIAVEKAAFHDWLLRKILELQKANPEDDAKVMSGIHELIPGLQEHGDDALPPSLWDQLAKGGGNTSQGIVSLLNDERPAYERLVALMALPYSEFDTAAKQFAADLKTEQAPLLAEALPAYLKARQREFKTQVRQAMLHTAVEYKLHGDAGLLKVTDPCGQGPFAFQRFVLDGVDRGFQLTSVFQNGGSPETLIFVEKSGSPFFLDGPYVGQSRSLPKHQAQQ